jgi:hypothetical protein
MNRLPVRLRWPLGVAALAVALLALLGLTPAFERAAVAHPLAPAAAPGEVWRLGVTSEGDASYTAVIGRLAGASASFRSNRGVADIYYIFPAPASARTIAAAAWNITNRTGSYTGIASMALEIRDSAGTLQRTVSAAPVNIQTATSGVWTDMPLSSTPANLVIAAGEHLVVHFALDSGANDNLDARTIFEVVVQ